jgi:lipopolysaccharide/colanic/teichoic acid biosynthesis glycosyltransferase
MAGQYMSTETSTTAPGTLEFGTTAPVRSPGRPTEHPAAKRSVGAFKAATQPRPPVAAPPARTADDALLPRRHFLAQLHREKRRADRSKAPLSIAIYRLAQHAGIDRTIQLSDLLLTCKRETDVVGELGPGIVAVICTETGTAGVQQFTKKIDLISGDLPYSVECATYPDQLFEGLAVSPDQAHGPSPLFSHSPLSDSYLLKRPIDVLGALLALLLFSPLMLVTALAVKLSSPGPIIFRQTRLGRGGVPFTFYKFRSIVADGDDRIHRDYVKSLIQGDYANTDQQDAVEPLYKIKADPRVTWVGRFIRKTSIDELPQLFNVFKGDMSLVGPRPPIVYEAEIYQSWHLRRVLDIKPGMTGLWQVEGRSKVTFDEMVRMDLRYVRGCSLSMDLRILAKTFPVVLSCEGAS